METSGIKPLRLVAMVLAGGRVGELSVLTLRRPKAALPFGGYFRIIDFALSNLMHAGITNVGILSQYRPGSLIDHVGVGECWDFVGLDRGAKILPPFRGAEASDWYRGNADAVYQNLNYIRDHSADMVLILSGDHIYRMDYRQLIQSHLDRGADMTVALKRMGHHERFGYGVLDNDDRLVAYEEKPVHPRSDLVSLTVYLVNTGPLVQVLTDLAGRELVEFGRDVLPAMLERYRVYGYEFRDYWAYTRSVESYYQAHQDLISGLIDLDEWEVRTNLQDARVAGQPPSRIGARAQVESSFISTGCEIEGTVIGSVLSPGVRVEKGARVVDSILFQHCRIEEGAVVERVIADKQVTVGSGAQVGARSATPPGGASPATSDPLTLLGKECAIGSSAQIEPGAEIQPEERIPSDSIHGLRR